MVLGVIGGSGIDGIGIENGVEKRVTTPFGEVVLASGNLARVETVFVRRHGPSGHPPHRIDYRAHVRALADSAARQVVAISAVGSLSLKHPPGFFSLPSQYIDLVQDAWGFSEERAMHADMTYPFCAEMRRILKAVGDKIDARVVESGVYARTRGPQFETAAEVDMLLHLGAHLCGMTVTPEAKLFRELGICYQPLCIVVNWAAGVSGDPIMHEGTLRGVADSRGRVEAILRGCAAGLSTLGPHDHSTPPTGISAGHAH